MLEYIVAKGRSKPASSDPAPGPPGDVRCARVEMMSWIQPKGDEVSMTVSLSYTKKLPFVVTAGFKTVKLVAGKYFHLR